MTSFTDRTVNQILNVGKFCRLSKGKDVEHRAMRILSNRESIKEDLLTVNEFHYLTRLLRASLNKDGYTLLTTLKKGRIYFHCVVKKTYDVIEPLVMKAFEIMERGCRESDHVSYYCNNMIALGTIPSDVYDTYQPFVESIIPSGYTFARNDMMIDQPSIILYSEKPVMLSYRFLAGEGVEQKLEQQKCEENYQVKSYKAAFATVSK